MTLLRLTIAALLLATPAHAVSLEAKAFLLATKHPTDRQQAVLDGMNDYQPLERLVKDGRLATVYDCQPDLRLTCFDVLKDPSGETVLEEWGDWYDNEIERIDDYVAEQIAAATKLGFNLLSNEELKAAAEQPGYGLLSPRSMSD